jgi:hypothetical protein
MEYFKNTRTKLLPQYVQFIPMDSDADDQEDVAHGNRAEAKELKERQENPSIVFTQETLYECNICKQGRITIQCAKHTCIAPGCLQIFCEECYQKKRQNKYCSRMCQAATEESQKIKVSHCTHNVLLIFRTQQNPLMKRMMETTAK